MMHTMFPLSVARLSHENVVDLLHWILLKNYVVAKAPDLRWLWSVRTHHRARSRRRAPNDLNVDRNYKIPNSMETSNYARDQWKPNDFSACRIYKNDFCDGDKKPCRSLYHKPCYGCSWQYFFVQDRNINFLV